MPRAVGLRLLASGTVKAARGGLMGSLRACPFLSPLARGWSTLTPLL